MNPDFLKRKKTVNQQLVKTPVIVKSAITDDIEINEVELNLIRIQFIRHCTPITIKHCNPIDNYYRFELSTSTKSSTSTLVSFQIDGHVAMIIQEPLNASIELEDRIRVIVISFNHAVLKKTMKARYGLHYASILWQTEIKEDSSHHTLLHSLVAWIIQELEKNILPMYENWIHVEKALLELFIDNLDRRNSIRPEDYEIKRAWFAELEQWIANNLTDPIALDDLALVAGVSVRAIQKAFQEYRGCTPMKAVTQHRLVKAREMLMNPKQGMTVLDVAMNLGYLHPSRFASQYKKKFGENPSETLIRCR